MGRETFHRDSTPARALKTTCAGIIVALVCTSCGDGDLAEAQALLTEGNFLAARARYECAVQRVPRDFAAQYGLGMTWCAEAIYKTELGLARPPDWYPAIYHVSMALNLRGSDEVRATLAVLYFNLGASFRRHGDTLLAIDRMEQAITYDTTLLKAINLLGTIYHGMGDYDNARRCYRRAIAVRPDYAMAHFNLGAIAWSQGSYDSAQAYFMRAAGLDAGNSLYGMWARKAGERLRQTR